MRRCERAPTVRRGMPRVRTQRSGLRISSPGRRTSSRGASARSVPPPTRIASDLRPQGMAMRPRHFPRQPAVLARLARQAAIERQGELERDFGTAKAALCEIARQARSRLGRWQQFRFDSGVADAGQALPGGARIGILAADDYPRQAACRNQIGAGRAALRLVRAGFQRNIKRRALRRFARSLQRQGLGMRPAAQLGPAPPKHTALAHDNRTHRRIGPRAWPRPCGEAGSRRQPALIFTHQAICPRQRRQRALLQPARSALALASIASTSMPDMRPILTYICRTSSSRLACSALSWS